MALLLLMVLASASRSIVVEGALQPELRRQVESCAQSPQAEECARILLSDWHAEHGFPFARFHFVQQLRGLDTVLVVEADRGELWLQAEPRNRDTCSSPAWVLARVSGLAPGDPVSLSHYADLSRRLLRMGWFQQTAEPSVFRDPHRNLLVPVLSVRDAPRHTLAGALGWADDGGGADGSLELSLRNLGGRGRSVDFMYEGSDSLQDASLRLSEPWLLRGPVGITLYGHLVREDTVLARDQGEATVLRIADGGEDSLLVTAGAERTRTEKSGSGRAWWGSVARVLDYRDREWMARSGWLIAGALQWLERHEAGESLRMARIRGKAQVFQSWWNRWPSAAKVSGALVLPGDRSVSSLDLWHVGGASDLRGYRERQFPVRAYWLFTTEQRMLLSDRVGLLALCDMALLEDNQWQWRHRSACGGGLEQSGGGWRGSVVVAYPFEEGETMVHLRVEQDF